MAHTASELTAGAVRAELDRRKRSALDLAHAIGMSPTTMKRRMSGRSPFDVEELAAIAAALDVPVTDLLPTGRAA